MFKILCVLCALNLQILSYLLCNILELFIVLYRATNKITSYIDVRVRFFDD